MLPVVVSAMMVASVNVCPGAFVPPAAPLLHSKRETDFEGVPVPVEVNVLNTIINKLPQHRMVGVDMSMNTAPCGANAADFTNPDFKFLVSQLAGGLIRYSGSATSVTVYNVSENACSPYNMSKTQPSGLYYCPAVVEKPVCLSVPRWQAMNHFASSAGLEVVLGLNGCWLRNSSTTSISWNGIEGLLSTTASASWSALHAVEFGDLITSKVTSTQYSRDLNTLKGYISQYWKQSPPGIIAPDQIPADVNTSYLTRVAKSTQLEALSVHLFYTQCLDGGSQVLNVSCVEGLDYKRIPPLKSAAAAGNASLYSTQTAFSDDLRPDKTLNDFSMMFWYAGTMGRLAAMGVGWVGYRDLLGKKGALISSIDTTPGHGYWFLLLWNYIVGTEVFETHLTCNNNNPVCLESFRGYALSGKGGGGKVLFMLNYHTAQSFNVTCSWGGISATSMDMFQLTGSASDPVLSLNGAPLVYTGKGISGFPLITPTILQPTDTIILPAQSITFLIRNI